MLYTITRVDTRVDMSVLVVSYRLLLSLVISIINSARVLSREIVTLLYDRFAIEVKPPYQIRGDSGVD